MLAIRRFVFVSDDTVPKTHAGLLNIHFATFVAAHLMALGGAPGVVVTSVLAVSSPALVFRKKQNVSSSTAGKDWVFYEAYAAKMQRTWPHTTKGWNFVSCVWRQYHMIFSPCGGGYLVQV